MITSDRQRWHLGSTVNVGFLRGLRVVAHAAVRDYLPDHYLLERAGVWYRFTPHNGLHKLGAVAPAEWWT